MKNLYKRLGVDESSGEGEIRAALAAADAATREAAGFILLDPRRRPVYDRNRGVLATIGQLRAHLRLNLTRFWPRTRFEDFTFDLAPPPRGRYIDPMTMAWAMGVQPPSPPGARSRLRRAALAAGSLVALTAALLVAWRLHRGG
jgi:hypothetical protein